MGSPPPSAYTPAAQLCLLCVTPDLQLDHVADFVPQLLLQLGCKQGLILQSCAGIALRQAEVAAQVQAGCVRQAAGPGELPAELQEISVGSGGGTKSMEGLGCTPPTPMVPLTPNAGFHQPETTPDRSWKRLEGQAHHSHKENKGRGAEGCCTEHRCF